MSLLFRKKQKPLPHPKILNNNTSVDGVHLVQPWSHDHVDQLLETGYGAFSRPLVDSQTIILFQESGICHHQEGKAVEQNVGTKGLVSQPASHANQRQMQAVFIQTYATLTSAL